MKKIVLIAAILSTFAVTGCETAKGVGRDVRNAGETIKNLVY